MTYKRPKPSDKLARKLGWHVPFALRAIKEYKKFVYLGVVNQFGVTPSKVIDQVWHEHLLFTRAYRQFCSEVLQCQFDHNPELVPVEDETGVFNAQYRATLSSYEKEFHMSPPADIWAVPKFAASGVPVGYYEPRLQEIFTDDVSYDDTPLYMLFENSDSDDEQRRRFSVYGFESGGIGTQPASTAGDSGPTDSHHSDPNRPAPVCADGHATDGKDTGCAPTDSGNSHANAYDVGSSSQTAGGESSFSSSSSWSSSSSSSGSSCSSSSNSSCSSSSSPSCSSSSGSSCSSGSSSSSCGGSSS